MLNNEKTKLLEDMKLEQERKRRVSINKKIVKRVEELNEEMNEMYENACKAYKILLNYHLNQQKSDIFAWGEGDPNDEIERKMILELQNKNRIEFLEEKLLKEAEERKVKFNHGIEMIRCELDSDYRRKYNIARAKRIDDINKKIRNGEVKIYDREIEKKKIKTSLVKATTPESRLRNSMKLKLEHPSKKPTGVR